MGCSRKCAAMKTTCSDVGLAREQIEEEVAVYSCLSVLFAWAPGGALGLANGQAIGCG